MKKWTPQNRALVIRTAAADMSSHNGFKWPKKGYVECPDWDPKPQCGHGLHGLIDGVGDYGLLASDHNAHWLIVEVDRTECVEITDKVKFPRGNVIYCGELGGALAIISQEWISIALKSATATIAKKKGGHAAAQGDEGHAAAQGGYGHAAALGKNGIAVVQGLDGQAKAGENGTIVLAWWDQQAERHRITVGYVGEDGIEPDTWYRVNDGQLVASQKGVKK